MVTSKVKLKQQKMRQDIKSTAFRIIDETDVIDVSMSAIGKALAMRTSALYYYYENREALITEMIVDVYADLRQALKSLLDAHAEYDVATQIWLNSLNYRAWAVANRTEYKFAFISPISNFELAPDISLREERSMGAMTVELLLEAEQSGFLNKESDFLKLPESLLDQFEPVRYEFGYDLPPHLLYMTFVVGTFVRNLVSQEINDVHAPVITDYEIYYRHTVFTFLKSVGIQLSEEVKWMTIE